MNINYILLSLLICFTCSACFVYNSGVISTNQTRYFDDEQYHKRYAQFVDQGNSIYKANYHYLIEATPEGNYILKQINPDKLILTHYTTYLDKDLLIKDGPAMELWDNSHYRWKGAYSNNQATGQWKYYNFDDGTLLSEGKKLLGEKTGIWTTYSGKDTISQINNYVKGVLEGESTFYNKIGTPTKKVTYENGEILKEEIIIPDAHNNIMESMPYFKSASCTKVTDTEERQACSQRKMLEAIYTNIQYPTLPRELEIEGTVFIHFIINSAGRMEKIQVMRGVCKELETECLRILPFIDNWQAGVQNNEAVNVAFTLPIKFKLE